MDFEGFLGILMNELINIDFLDRILEGFPRDFQGILTGLIIWDIEVDC